MVGASCGCELHSNLVSLHSETTVDTGSLYDPSCELHSNLVSLHSETTSEKGVRTAWKVVNYIQILYLCILKQRTRNISIDRYSCELHSNLVSLHSETTRLCLSMLLLQLWITFKSCIFAFWNNLTSYYLYLIDVVNYIQILYLCILKQQKWFSHPSSLGCELHSNLVSLHSETTWVLTETNRNQLWITFKSCIFAFWNNQVKHVRSCW